MQRKNVIVKRNEVIVSGTVVEGNVVIDPADIAEGHRQAALIRANRKGVSRTLFCGKYVPSNTTYKHEVKPGTNQEIPILPPPAAKPIPMVEQPIMKPTIISYLASLDYTNVKGVFATPGRSFFSETGTHNDGPTTSMEIDVEGGVIIVFYSHIEILKSNDKESFVAKINGKDYRGKEIITISTEGKISIDNVPFTETNDASPQMSASSMRRG